MRLEWLEDILAVAETGSFTEAAARRRLTQSAFSRRIRQIEYHVGAELFDRRSKPVRLSPTTEAQRERIALLAGQLRQLEQDLCHGDKAAGNRITIASQHALTAAMAPSIIENAQNHTFVRVQSANLDECLSLLLSRRVDLALLYRNPGNAHPVRPDFVETAVIGADRLLPVIGISREAWAREQITDNELTYIAYPANVFLGKVMEGTVLSQLRSGCRMVARAETALTIAALEMAMAGFAVGWVPHSLARARISDGTLADLSDRLPATDLEITAVRLTDPGTGHPGHAIWSQLTARTNP